MDSTPVIDRMNAQPPLHLPSDQDASGRSFGDEEIAAVARVLASGTLTSTKGTAVRALEQRLAARFGCGHAIACTSGTAAIHAAVAAIDPEPGDEIISSPITDMGAITPILYQGAVPVFADVDPRTGCLTGEAVRAVMSPRTRAVVVTHLFGRPAPLADIRAVTAPRNIPIIEDAAQAYLATSGGRVVGTVGSIGCFSLQQGKHITTGEGGFVLTDDAAAARRMRLFVNKAFGYGEADPDHEFLAPNYRMNELTGAVALAQLDKLGDGVGRRVATARRFAAAIADLPGIDHPNADPGDTAVYWKFVVNVDERKIPGGANAVAAGLKVHGVASAPGYIRKPAFECRIFWEKRTFGRSQYPFTLARPDAVDYDPARFPGTYAALRQCLVLPWNERYTDDHVDQLAAVFRSVVEREAAR